MQPSYVATSFIYGIFSKENDTLGYIGQTVDLLRRERRHLNPVSRKPRNVDIWIEYENKNVYFKILEQCFRNEAKEKEKLWKRKLKPIVRD